MCKLFNRVFKRKQANITKVVLTHSTDAKVLAKGFKVPQNALYLGVSGNVVVYATLTHVYHVTELETYRFERTLS